MKRNSAGRKSLPMQEVWSIWNSITQEFIEFMVDCNVLKFGDFVTKSGRKNALFCKYRFFTAPADSYAVWESIMPKPLAALTVLILTCCLVPLIKESL